MSERLEDIAAGWSPTARAFWRPTRAPARSRSGSTRSASNSTADSRRDYREMLFRADEAMTQIHLRRHSLRRDAPPEGGRRHAAGRHHPRGRRRARHQGRRRRQAAGGLSRRNHHRRPRRPARAARRILQARRPLRQMARRHRNLVAYSLCGHVVDVLLPHPIE